MNDVKFRYTKDKKIQIAKGLIPAAIGLAVGVVSLWKTATQTGQDQMLSMIDNDTESGGELFTATDSDGIIREYRSERIGD